MRFVFYYLVFKIFLRNPLLTLFILVVLYLLTDRRFIGLFPDFLRPFKRKQRIRELEKQVQINPADVNAYRELGQLYMEGKNYLSAVNSFEKCLDKMNGYADIHFGLGKGLYFLGRKEEGMEEIHKALNINPKIGYGEPYIYLLENQLTNEYDGEKINNYIQKIRQFGTPEILYKGGVKLYKYDQVKAKELLQEGLNTYKVIPRNFRKVHRRWALLTRLKLLGK